MAESIAGTVAIKVKADAEGVKTGLSSAEKEFKSFSSSVTTSLKAITATQIYQVAKDVVGFVGDAIREIEEDNRISARLDKVVENTGQAAGLTADKMREMAAEMEYTTNFSRDANTAAMALLATFTNIKGTQFTDALKAAADLASFRGTSIEEEAGAIGRALEDPEEGFKALRAAGILFADDVKAKIKSLQREGNIEAAQQMMLSQINSKMAGMSEAVSSPLTQAANHIQEAWENVLQVIVAVANPLLVVFNKIAYVVGTAKEGVVGFFTSLVPGSHYSGIQQTADDLKRVQEEAKAAEQAMKRLQAIHQQALDSIGKRRDSQEKSKDTAFGSMSGASQSLEDRLTEMGGGNPIVERLRREAAAYADEFWGDMADNAKAEEFAQRVEDWAKSYTALEAHVEAVSEAKRLELELEKQLYGAEEARLRQLKAQGASAEDIGRVRELQEQLKAEQERAKAAEEAAKEAAKMEEEQARGAEQMQAEKEARARQIAQSVQTPEEKYRERINEIGALASEGLLTAGQVAAAERQALEEMLRSLGNNEKTAASGSFSPYATTMIGGTVQQQIADNTAETKRNTAETAKNTRKQFEVPKAG